MTNANVEKLIVRIDSNEVLKHLQQRATESGKSLAAWAARRITSKAAFDAQVDLLDQLMDAVAADATADKDSDDKQVSKPTEPATTKKEKKPRGKKAKAGDDAAANAEDGAADNAEETEQVAKPVADAADADTTTQE